MNNRQPMQSQNPKTRRANFDEVNLGYTQEMAVLEATRCLQCKHKPCVAGCPVNIQIPAFIHEIIQGNIQGAYNIITEDNLFPGICGRVCPQESQCEHLCVRGIKGLSVAIGHLERFVADHVPTCEVVIPLKNLSKVAIVGSGPAGLTCANELAKAGYQVTIFEALHAPGGVLMYGIPEFRLPKAIVINEIQKLRAMGVDIITNAIIGKTLTIPQLFEDGYQAIFLGSGAGLPKFMDIPGEQYKGVFSANEYLTRINLMKAYDPKSDTPLYPAKKVCIIGGGNVAMDAARCALRLGSEQVMIVYRRTEEEMPARIEEIAHAKEEGIDFKFLTNPVAIHASNTQEVTALECIQMVLGEADASGRRKPIPVPNSNFSIPCDEVIMALGNHPNPLLTKETKGLMTDKYGCFVVNEHLMTSIPGVFAGGDAVTGAATVILAMEAGKIASQSIKKYLKAKE
ncbi:MAG: NADPH-dependent glutamate synthase [Bacilli bacterium]|nr:NADPH-dependent glutamate synthase [Bacilli bacterium]